MQLLPFASAVSNTFASLKSSMTLRPAGLLRDQHGIGWKDSLPIWKFLSVHGSNYHQLALGSQWATWVIGYNLIGTFNKPKVIVRFLLHVGARWKSALHHTSHCHKWHRGIDGCCTRPQARRARQRCLLLFKIEKKKKGTKSIPSPEP